ncbi:MAG TPA: hypothetical protein VJ815_00830 [Acidimicrobiia bacterium]|nr:hypothetical protein [Acidimicrobiia bacterium]
MNSRRSDEIRDLGSRAAAEVVDRFIRLMGEDPRPPGQSADRSAAFRQLRADLARAVDANLDLIRRAFDLYAGAIDRLLGGETDGRHFKMPPVLSGHQASSTLWIHNTTGAAATSLRLHGSELVNHNRATIPGDAWRFEPGEIDIAPSGSSLPVAVALDVPGDAVAGVYRGHVFVTNLPGEYMAVEIEVVQPAREGAGINQEQRWQDQQQAS